MVASNTATIPILTSDNSELAAPTGYRSATAPSELLEELVDGEAKGDQ
jgi:hypothetical protein